MISKYDIWFFSFPDNKKSFNILKVSFIHTMVDLIYSLMEQFVKKEKNYMYEIIGSKIFKYIRR